MSCRASACLIAGLAGLLALALGTAQADNNQPAGWGTVKGQIVLTDGTPMPERKKLDVNKDQGHCLAKGDILSQEWMVNKNSRGVQYVYVWLAPEPNGSPLAIHPQFQQPPSEPAVMDQPQCMFEPHAIAMRQGQVLIAKNSSPVAHNYNWQSAKNQGNQLIPANGEYQIKNLEADRVPMVISCNIHPWMKGWVRVFDHPYYAVTDAEGKFEIKNAPAGKCRIVIWHEAIGFRGGAMGRAGEQIEIKADGVTEVKHDIQPKKE
jgi:hypothetical protein